jgi:thiamine-monophosphate kinase
VTREAASTALGPGVEFDLVRRLVGRWGAWAQGIGDDAAILDLPAGSRLVASIDSSVEGVHFRRQWLSMEEIGWRAAASGLSDLAAMGAAPVGLLAAITMPRSEVTGDGASPALDRLADGVGACAASAGCPIVGGDLTRGERWCLTISVLGAAAAPVRRGGARPGDQVYVTGRLGGPGAALRALARGGSPVPAHRERLARPLPRLAEGRWLASHRATAMIDVSDGLASDLGHLAAASDVAIAVALESVPCVDEVTPVEAVVSGEEYELACTAPGGLDTAEFTRRFGLPLTPIGAVHTGPAGVAFALRGVRVDPGRGYDHFSP